MLEFIQIISDIKDEHKYDYYQRLVVSSEAGEQQSRSVELERESVNIHVRVIVLAIKLE